MKFNRFDATEHYVRPIYRVSRPVAKAALAAALPLRVRVSPDGVRFFVEWRAGGLIDAPWVPWTNGGSFDDETARRVYLQARRSFLGQNIS